MTFGIEPLGHALTSPSNRLRIRCSGLDGELRALVKMVRKDSSTTGDLAKSSLVLISVYRASIVGDRSASCYTISSH